MVRIPTKTGDTPISKNRGFIPPGLTLFSFRGPGTWEPSQTFRTKHRQWHSSWPSPGVQVGPAWLDQNEIFNTRLEMVPMKPRSARLSPEGAKQPSVPPPQKKKRGSNATLALKSFFEGNSSKERPGTSLCTGPLPGDFSSPGPFLPETPGPGAHSAGKPSADCTPTPPRKTIPTNEPRMPLKLPLPECIPGFRPKTVRTFEKSTTPTVRLSKKYQGKELKKHKLGGSPLASLERLRKERFTPHRTPPAIFGVYPTAAARQPLAWHGPT